MPRQRPACPGRRGWANSSVPLGKGGVAGEGIDPRDRKGTGPTFEQGQLAGSAVLQQASIGVNRRVIEREGISAGGPALPLSIIGLPGVALVFNPTTVILSPLRCNTPVLPAPNATVAVATGPSPVGFSSVTVPASMVTGPVKVLAWLSVTVPV